MACAAVAAVAAGGVGAVSVRVAGEVEEGIALVDVGAVSAVTGKPDVADARE
jgi:hypothetical protein